MKNLICILINGFFFFLINSCGSSESSVYGVMDSSNYSAEEEVKKTVPEKSEAENLKIILEIETDLLVKYQSGYIKGNGLPLLYYNEKAKEFIISSNNTFKKISSDNLENGIKYFQSIMKKEEALEKKNLFPELDSAKIKLFTKSQLEAFYITNGREVMKEMTKDGRFILYGNKELLQLFYKGERTEFKSSETDSAFGICKKYFTELNLK